MSTINNKIEILNQSETGYDTYHPETNVGNVYDFTKSKWLNEVINDIEREISTLTGSIDISDLNDSLNLAIEDIESIEDLISSIQAQLLLRYIKSPNGIPLGDLETSIRTSIAKADRVPQIEADLATARDYIDQQIANIDTTDVLNEAKDYTDQQVASVTSSMRVTTEEFVSTAGQTIFTLANIHNLNTNTIRVEVGGVEQFSTDNYTKTTIDGITRITFSSGLPIGISVMVIYFGGIDAINLVMDNHMSNRTSDNHIIISSEEPIVDGGVTFVVTDVKPDIK